MVGKSLQNSGIMVAIGRLDTPMKYFFNELLLGNYCAHIELIIILYSLLFSVLNVPMSTKFRLTFYWRHHAMRSQ